jgi:hypothetical protein
MYDEIHVNEMVWDGRQWVLESTLEARIGACRVAVLANSHRYVKRAPLGMMLTRNDGFRMVAP